MAYCVKCGDAIPGKYIDGQMQTCIHCSPTIAMQSQETVIRRPPSASSPAQQKKEPFAKALMSFFILGIIALAGVGLFLIGLMAYQSFNRGKDSAQVENEQKTQPPTTATPQKTVMPQNVPGQSQIERPQTQPTVIDRSENFPANVTTPREILPANTQPDVSFSKSIVNETFPVAATRFIYFGFRRDYEFALIGNYSATGGSNDIDFFIVDGNEFINFQNGNDFRSYYTRRKTTTDSVKLRLQPGTYYLIFSNKMAIMTNKVVKASFETD